MITKSQKIQFRQKRSDTLIGTLEKKYKVNFKAKSNMKLGNYLEREGLPSLSQALKKIK